MSTSQSAGKTLAKVLQAIELFQNENHGISPTYRELCTMCGVTSTQTMKRHLERLKKAGFIDFVPNKARTIRLLDTKRGTK